ncbi:MAG TPA: MFS transporter [Burkholderiales bacterium]|nr:MFS transporter [Burkholderiales bacterium]
MTHKLHYGWTIVAAGAFMTCVGFGALFSLAVFLSPMSEATGWSRTGISSAMTLDFLVMGVAGFGWGALSDRFGARAVTLAGSLLLGAGLVLASRAGSLIEFQVLYGVLVGAAAGSLFPPLIALTTAWFDTHRSLAVSLVSTGVGVAPMTVSPFAAWLITHTDWRTAQLVIGIGAWAIMIPCALLLRSPASPRGVQPQACAEARAAPAEDGMRVGQALRSWPFIVLGLTFFACCAAHSGPIFHTVSYAISCGLAPMAAVTIYSAEGLAGLGGRLVFGLAGDRFGAKRALVAGLLIQAFAAGAYLFTAKLGEFYAAAAVFGMAYGGVMPLYAVLAREYFGQRILGTVFGAATMVSSLGMALGPAAGGWIFDTFHGYGFLYMGAFGIGLGAAAIALAFPPLPRRASGLQPA